MAKGIFSFTEMALNVTCSGARIYYEEELKVVDYIKVEKKSRQLIVHCVDGTVFPCSEDELFEFEVNNNKVLRKSNRGRLRGKDHWGTVEVEK